MDIIVTSSEQLKSLIREVFREELKAAPQEQHKTDQPEYLDTRALMKMLSLTSKGSIRNHVRAGKLPRPVKVPGSRKNLWLREDVVAVLHSNKSKKVR